jgi:hypothetical protein
MYIYPKTKTYTYAGNIEFTTFYRSLKATSGINKNDGDG